MFARTVLTMSTAAALLTAPAAADPAPKADFVFAVKEGVMTKCIADVDIIFGLANAALQDHEALGRRDVHRIVNTCLLRHRLARRNALSYVALEAFENAQCLDEECRMRYREPLAKKTFALSATFTASYAEVLHGNLVDACSQTHEVDCVARAVERTAEQPIATGFDWLEVDGEGRLAGLSDVDAARYGTVPDISDVSPEAAADLGSSGVDADAIPQEFMKIRDAITSASPEDIPSEDLVSLHSEELAEEFTLEGDRIVVGDEIAPVSVTGVNGLLRFSVPAPRDVCIGLMSQAADFEATEITVGKDLWVAGSDPDAVCPHTKTDVRIVY